MLPFKLVYSDGYDLNLGAHVFPSQKYRLMQQRLLQSGIACAQDFVEPQPASDPQLLLVHSRVWIEKLKTGALSDFDRMQLEIPYSPQMVQAFWLAAGGTTLSARLALRDRLGFNIGGGFHHAFPAHGEGFCAIHDVAVAIRVLQQEKLIRRAMIVDCDVHHGNGSAGVFANDDSVFTLSIHQLDNYPDQKPPSNIDIHLADGTGDDEYLRQLEQALLPALAEFQPELLMYIAGADPYREDQLGGLALTMDGLERRDRLVFTASASHQIPVAVTLAGGYAKNVEDTVTIHCNTVIVAARCLLETFSPPAQSTH